MDASKTTTINRRPRYWEPLPQQKIKLPAPPLVNPPAKSSWLIALLPLAGVFIMIAFYGGATGNYTMAIPMASMSLISVITSFATRSAQKKAYKKQLEEKEAAYAKAFQERRNELETWRREQKRILINKDPDPQILLFRAQQRDPSLWERTPNDGDFLNLRLGTGSLPSTITIEAPQSDVPDPRLETVYAIQHDFSFIPQVPVLADLKTGPVGIIGNYAERNAIARSLICNLVVHHSPDEVHLLAIYPPQQAQHWQWLMWLPHTYALQSVDKPYLANDALTAQTLLKELLEELHRRQNQLYGVQHGGPQPNWPWLVLLIADNSIIPHDPALDLLLSREGRALNVTGVFLVDHVARVPAGSASYVECLPQNNLRYVFAGYGSPGYTQECVGDAVGVTHCEQLARALAPLKVYTVQSESALPSHVRLFDMLRIRDIHREDIAARWNTRTPEAYLKVVIGERRGNQPLILDLNHTGHGPHGLVAGTTGSGKSELLQSLVLALALTHHPYDVGFVLVDFKGGGTFSELEKLPHTLGMVTDLSGSLTTRALIALQAEVDKRKRLFNDANVNDIGPYQKKYWDRKVQEPLPRLIVIIDEFAELVSDYPDFMEGLIAIARVGRSLGVHLILATQSPAGVVNQQIWANAKFRICLRVESRQESSEMLHRPEAANLPRTPGRGYLQVGNNDVFELFQAAYVGGPYKVQGATDTLLPGQLDHFVINEVTPLGKRNKIFDSKKNAAQHTSKSAATDLDVGVQHLINVGKQQGISNLPSPWPDPLPEWLAFTDVLQRIGFSGWNGQTWDFTNGVATPQINQCPQCQQPVRSGAKFCGSCGHKVSTSSATTNALAPRQPNLKHRPWLTAVVGLLDDPANQRQIPFCLDLADQDGQFVLVGAPGAGKESWLRTLVMSLAYTHAPDEVHFCLLEFGGQALRVFENLPHTMGVFTPLDEERIKRLLLLLGDSLEERKNQCSKAGVDSLVKLRELQPGAAFPAIVVIVIGFSEFRNTFQDEQLQFTRLIREGGPYGIHIIIAGDRAGDIPSAVSSVVGRKAALRLADLTEYPMILGTSLKINKDQQIPIGRGWYGRPPLEFQTAEPAQAKDELLQIAELQQTIQAMQQAVANIQQIQPDWRTQLPEPVENLPTLLPLVELSKRARESVATPPFLSAPIGIDGVRMRPAWIDLVADGSDFIVAGSSQGGKTTLLWAWLLALAEQHSPQEVQFILISGRRNSLRPLQRLLHVVEFCRNAEEFQQNNIIAKITAEIDYREKELSSDPAAVNTLPHLLLVCDDYDEFFNTLSNERDIMIGLERLAKRGRDVNMHTIISGPLPGMGVGYSDPITKQLKLGRSGVLLRLLDTGDQNPLGVRVRPADIRQMPPGRGFIVRNGVEQAAHIATPGDQATVEQLVIQLVSQWKDSQAATWSTPEEETA